MSGGSADPIFISIRCGCGAMLLIDASPAWNADLATFQGIALAWIKEHGPHYPNTNPASQPNEDK